MTMSKLSQKQIVGRELKSYGVITNLWAIKNGIWRLGAVIFDLRKAGWEIETTMVGKIAHYTIDR